MRIGIDLGGTQIEALALSAEGRELERIRIATPREDYGGTLEAITSLVWRLERELGESSRVGRWQAAARRANAEFCAQDSDRDWHVAGRAHGNWKGNTGHRPALQLE